MMADQFALTEDQLAIQDMARRFTADAITLPARIARVKPISSSNGPCAGMRCRPSAGSAMAMSPLPMMEPPS